MLQTIRHKKSAKGCAETGMIKDREGKMSQGIIKSSTFIAAFGAEYHLLGDGRVRATLTMGAALQGPPGYAHGGSLASLLDEAMGAASWFAGNRTVSVHLAFDYQRPVALGAAVQVFGQVDRREGRKIFTSGSILLADGSIAVSASGIFVDAPAMLGEASGFTLKTDK